MTFKQTLLLGGALGAFAVVGCYPPTFVRSSDEMLTTTEATVRGRVSSVTYSPSGTVTGFFLEAGTRVLLSSPNANQLSALVPPGQRVEVRGWVVNTAGGPAIEAQWINNVDSNQSVNLRENRALTRAAPISPAPGYGGSGLATSDLGLVSSFSVGPEGRVNGFTLDDGRPIRFTTVDGAQVQTFVRIGQRVQVNGWEGIDVNNARVINANSITNLETNDSIKVTPESAVKPIAPFATPR